MTAGDYQPVCVGNERLLKEHGGRVILTKQVGLVLSALCGVLCMRRFLSNGVYCVCLGYLMLGKKAI